MRLSVPAKRLGVAMYRSCDVIRSVDKQFTIKNGRMERNSFCSWLSLWFLGFDSELGRGQKASKALHFGTYTKNRYGFVPSLFQVTHLQSNSGQKTQVVVSCSLAQIPQFSPSDTFAAKLA